MVKGLFCVLIEYKNPDAQFENVEHTSVMLKFDKRTSHMLLALALVHANRCMCVFFVLSPWVHGSQNRHQPMIKCMCVWVFLYVKKVCFHETPVPRKWEGENGICVVHLHKELGIDDRQYNQILYIDCIILSLIYF